MRTSTTLWAASLAIASLSGPLLTTAEAAPAAHVARPRYYFPRHIKRQLFPNITLPGLPTQEPSVTIVDPEETDAAESSPPIIQLPDVTDLFPQEPSTPAVVPTTQAPEVIPTTTEEAPVVTSDSAEEQAPSSTPNGGLGGFLSSLVSPIAPIITPILPDLPESTSEPVITTPSEAAQTPVETPSVVETPSEVVPPSDVPVTTDVPASTPSGLIPALTSLLESVLNPPPATPTADTPPADQTPTDTPPAQDTVVPTTADTPSQPTGLIPGLTSVLESVLNPPPATPTVETPPADQTPIETPPAGETIVPTTAETPAEPSGIIPGLTSLLESVLNPTPTPSVESPPPAGETTAPSSILVGLTTAIEGTPAPSEPTPSGLIPGLSSVLESVLNPPTPTPTGEASPTVDPSAIETLPLPLPTDVSSIVSGLISTLSEVIPTATDIIPTITPLPTGGELPTPTIIPSGSELPPSSLPTGDATSIPTPTGGEPTGTGEPTPTGPTTGVPTSLGTDTSIPTGEPTATGPEPTITGPSSLPTPTTPVEEPTGATTIGSPTAEPTGAATTGDFSTPAVTPSAPSPSEPADTGVSTLPPATTQPAQSPMPTGTDTFTSRVVPSSIFVAPSVTVSTSIVSQSAMPSGMIQVIPAPDGMPAAPPNTTLVQVGFRRELNYEFVISNNVSPQQIFSFLPQGVSHGLKIDQDSIVMSAIRPYDTRNSLGYITTLAQFYIPTDKFNQMAIDIKVPSSQLYNNPDLPVESLMKVINPAIPLAAGTQVPDTAAGGGYGPGPTSSSTPGGDSPMSGGGGTKSPVVASSVGIAFAAIGGVAAYGAAMFFVARRYKKRRNAHSRSNSVPSTRRASTAMGYAWMSGARGTGRDSRGSDNSGSGRSGRTAQISAPMMAENSLGWN